MLNPDDFQPSEEFTSMVKKRIVSCPQESHETVTGMQDLVILYD